MKLIATDLDGTLLNSKNEISDENLTAIKEAQSKGIQIVIATGRAHYDVQAIIERDGLSNVWIVGANGATIHDPYGKQRHSVPMKKDTIIDVLDWLEGQHFYYEIFTNKAIYTPNNGRELLKIEIDRLKSSHPETNTKDLIKATEKQYSQMGFAFIPSYKEIINKDDIEIYNILAFSFDHEKLNEGKERFSRRPEFSLVVSANHNFEIEDNQASKGLALERIANELQIPIEQTMAIGDSFNDLSMIERAGMGVAMGNARDEIKISSDRVTLDNNENGVAYIIREILK
ncbi:Cof-type HAD-IIB family hydrolase [Terrilactibacillus laevilacticus]|uniref:Cof-type HAD-IIB family hydrolase n=1 Tax=Terrilactibacillus laevilacticus TaxID=1380157 RepID=A0ABW5PL26_9BACI|nr:Cof-type HAD-IIB family hydrolase [Terrilactibacillus laevilacticus]